jgi:hypothetical protein
MLKRLEKSEDRLRRLDWLALRLIKRWILGAKTLASNSYYLKPAKDDSRFLSVPLLLFMLPTRAF